MSPSSIFSHGLLYCDQLRLHISQNIFANFRNNKFHVKHQFFNSTMLHARLCSFQITEREKKRTMCQRTNYLPPIKTKQQTIDITFHSLNWFNQMIKEH